MITPIMSYYDEDYIKSLLRDERVFEEWTLHEMLVDEMHMILTTIGECEWTPVQSPLSREWAKMSNKWIDTIGMHRVRTYTWADVGAIFEDVDMHVLMRYVRNETKMLFDRKYVARMLVCHQRYLDQ